MRKKRWCKYSISVLLTVMLAASLLTGCSPKSDGQKEPVPTDSHQQLASEQEAVVPDIEVETPCGALNYPGKWANRIRVEVQQAETVRVCFYGTNSMQQEGRIFDMVFGDAEMEILGAVKTENGELCNVGVFVYEPDPTVFVSEADCYEFYAMQEEINYLIEQLPLESKEQLAMPEQSTVVVQNKRPAVYADVLLETPYVTVAYPGEYAGLFHVELSNEEPYPVTFCWNNNGTIIRLFELAFGGEDTTRVGYLKDSGKSVHLTVYDVSEESELSEKNLDTALSLQEVLNDILARLPMQKQSVEEIPYISIETPYGVLCYPEEYQQHLEVEVEEYDGYTVHFRFLPENGETIAMFDIVFGGSAGTQVGQCIGKDGIPVPMKLEGYAVDAAEVLTEEELDLYYMMSEGVNFLLDKYRVMNTFVNE